MSKICNKCGKEIKEIENDFQIDRTFSYGGKHDMDIISLKLCQECFEDALEKIADECVINPIKVWSGDPYQPYED